MSWTTPQTTQAVKHGGDERGIDAAQSLGQTPVQEAGHKAVDRHLNGHGDGGGERRRHTEDSGAHQGRDKAHRCAPGAAAPSSRTGWLADARQQHITDLGDVSGKVGKE